jgi:hypothetical protein
MSKKKQWPEDPVVREVREARAKLWKEAGGTFEGLQRLVAERVGPTKKSKPKKRRTKV